MCRPMNWLVLLVILATSAQQVYGDRGQLKWEPASDDKKHELTSPTAATCPNGPAASRPAIFNSLNSSHNQLLLLAQQDQHQQHQQHQQQWRPPQQEKTRHGREIPSRQDRDLLAKVKSLVTEGFGRDEEAPLITSSSNAEDERHLAAAHMAFFKMDELSGTLSLAEWLHTGLIALAESAVYHNVYLHRYDTYEDMKRASGPAVNNELCVAQLARLAERADQLEREKYYSHDLNLFALLDTWGHLGSGVMSGRLFMDGSYSACVRYKIREPATAEERARGEIMSAREHIETRYCVLSVRHKGWPRADKNEILNMKWSVCLPKSCDSSNYKNKFELIGRIAQGQARRMEATEFRVNNMYCLPDEDSPLRSVRNSPRALAALVFFAGWLLFLVFATHKCNTLTRQVDEADLPAATSAFGLTNVSVVDKMTSKGEERVPEPEPKEAKSGADTKEGPGEPADLESRRAQLRVYRMFSITNNLRLLLDTTKSSSLMEASAASAKAGQSPVGELTSTSLVVDLRCLEGIKVITMAYVIMGHVAMCMFTIMANGRDFAGTVSPAFLLVNLVPAFAVNSFFTITGVLTCYLMFKQNKSQPVIRSPGKWVAFILYRYLRIMPMYALVVLYCKTLAKYTGSGPYWDYGTSSLGQRAACEQEPWHWTLLFISNFRPPLQHCIPGGWYLSNDFQFFLVTPLLIVALERSARWGQALLKALIVAGHSFGFYSIYSSPVTDLRPIAMFSPHGFKTYISHFSFNYTHPQYRIPAYLIGLLVGYKLFQHEEDKRRFNEQRAHLETSSPQEAANMSPPDWSEGFKRRGAFWSGLLVALCCAVPVLGTNLNPSLRAARWLVSITTPTCHVQFSAAVGMYILLATTGNGNKHVSRFLSASFWKPLARLSLCAVLVNVEVINYIIQTSASQHYVSIQYHMMLNMMCIVCTYLVSTVVCVLFEAPVRAGLNALLTHAITRVARKQKAN